MYAVLLFSFVLIAFAPFGVQAHTYHMGACPSVDPMPGFKMSKMLGEWYVIQKTSTASFCLLYNFTRGEEPGEYVVEQISQNPLLGLTPLKHQYRYVGRLTIPEPSTPGFVRFPINVAGDASFAVFSADYDNYAAIFTCQKLAFSHRQSVSILSRQKSLEKIYIDKVHAKLQSYNISPYDLSIINQTNCPNPESSEGYNIHIDSDTFSAASAAGLVRKAGEKIGDGIEFVAEGAKKVYHKFSDNKDDAKSKMTMDPDTEWLP